MARHDFSASEAYDLLLKRLESVSEELADRIREAVDAGKEVHEKNPEAFRGRGKRGKKQYFRKHVPLSPAEAFLKAVHMLEASLYEHRLVLNVAHDEFRRSSVALKKNGFGKGPSDYFGMEGEQKKLVVEGEVETVLSKEQRPDLELEETVEEEMTDLGGIFTQLRYMADFSEADHGNSG